VFDPAKVLDHATYNDPFQYNDGIEYVVVNGKLVFKQGQHTGAKPGMVLRHNLN
jgi:N-acyl-D-aspartate/D-glutamate deacylase